MKKSTKLKKKCNQPQKKDNKVKKKPSGKQVPTKKRVLKKPARMEIRMASLEPRMVHWPCEPSGLRYS